MIEYLKAAAVSEKRKAVRAYRIMVVCVAVTVFCGWSWSTSSERLDAAHAIIKSQQRSLDVMEMQTHANMVLLHKEQALAGEKEALAKKYKHLMHQAYGREGARQRKINELERTLEFLRSDRFTGNIEADMKEAKE